MRNTKFLLAAWYLLYSTKMIDASTDDDDEKKTRVRAADMHSDELELRLTSSREKEEKTFVHFYAPWCTHCEDTGRLWDALAFEGDHFYGTRIVSVDCAGSGAESCAAHGIHIYPTLMVFPSAESYSGLWEYDALLHWLHTLVPQFAQGPRSARFVEPVQGCKAWRATKNCDPEGPRDPANDLSCVTNVPAKQSGFCDCTGSKDTIDGSTTVPAGAKKLEECGEVYRKPFTCLEECAPVKECIMWRQTSRCLSTGSKDGKQDKSCRALISSGDSGYCECDGAGSTAAESDCGHRPFTCEDECRKVFVAKRVHEQELIQKEQARKNR